MNTLLLCVALLQASLYKQALSLPDGAPDTACANLLPAQGPHGEPQTSAVPYIIDLDQFCINGTYSYNPGQNYTGCKFFLMLKLVMHSYM